MPKAPKLFKIDYRKSGRDYTPIIGTLQDLVSYFAYTLEVGQSWQHEKGNRKINRNPKNIKSLVTNIQNAKDNAAANGYSGCYISEGVLTQEEIETYFSDNS